MSPLQLEPPSGDSKVSPYANNYTWGIYDLPTSVQHLQPEFYAVEAPGHGVGTSHPSTYWHAGPSSMEGQFSAPTHSSLPSSRAPQAAFDTFDTFDVSGATVDASYYPPKHDVRMSQAGEVGDYHGLHGLPLPLPRLIFISQSDYIGQPYGFHPSFGTRQNASNAFNAEYDELLYPSNGLVGSLQLDAVETELEKFDTTLGLTFPYSPGAPFPSVATEPIDNNVHKSAIKLPDSPPAPGVALVVVNGVVVFFDPHKASEPLPKGTRLQLGCMTGNPKKYRCLYINPFSDPRKSGPCSKEYIGLQGMNIHFRLHANTERDFLETRGDMTDYSVALKDPEFAGVQSWVCDLCGRTGKSTRIDVLKGHQATGMCKRRRAKYVAKTSSGHDSSDLPGDGPVRKRQRKTR